MRKDESSLVSGMYDKYIGTSRLLQLVIHIICVCILLLLIGILFILIRVHIILQYIIIYRCGDGEMSHEDLLIQRGIVLVDSITLPFYKLIMEYPVNICIHTVFKNYELLIYLICILAVLQTIYNINYPRAVYNMLQVY